MDENTQKISELVKQLNEDFNKEAQMSYPFNPFRFTFDGESYAIFYEDAEDESCVWTGKKFDEADILKWTINVLAGKKKWLEHALMAVGNREIQRKLKTDRP